jgi:CheY-like chemotaxis protein
MREEQLAAPDTFVDKVKQILEHLYDLPYLQRHDLTQLLAPGSEQSAELPVQALRRRVMDAIEILNPGGAVPFRAPHARLYNLLHLHYVEGLSIQEVARDLDLSDRQAYRDMRRAEENVAALLWEQVTIHNADRPESHFPPPRLRSLSTSKVELDRLAERLTSTDLVQLVVAAQESVERLANQRQIQLCMQHIEGPVVIQCEPTVAQQIVTGVHSHLIKHVRRGRLRVTVSSGPPVSISFQFECSNTDGMEPTGSMMNQLLERLGWNYMQEVDVRGFGHATLRIPYAGPKILVIDDNAELVELLERYLNEHTCQVISAQSGDEGLQLAHEIAPDAILLDVMMPQVDGWKVLQTLRSRPDTALIPVIMCSVINDPDLAYSLDVSIYLHKPISRDDILSALRKLNII